MKDEADEKIRKGKVLIGAYVPPEIKTALRQMAKQQHRTLSRVMTAILEDAVYDNKIKGNGK